MALPEALLEKDIMTDTRVRGRPKSAEAGTRFHISIPESLSNRLLEIQRETHANSLTDVVKSALQLSASSKTAAKGTSSALSSFSRNSTLMHVSSSRSRRGRRKASIIFLSARSRSAMPWPCSHRFASSTASASQTKSAPSTKTCFVHLQSQLSLQAS